MMKNKVNMVLMSFFMGLIIALHECKSIVFLENM